jgi:hypothetical protein
MKMGARLLVGAEKLIREKSHAFDSGILEERGRSVPCWLLAVGKIFCGC